MDCNEGTQLGLDPLQQNDYLRDSHIHSTWGTHEELGSVD